MINEKKDRRPNIYWQLLIKEKGTQHLPNEDRYSEDSGPDSVHKKGRK